MAMIVQTLSVLERENRKSLERAIARRFEAESSEELWIGARPEEHRYLGTVAPGGEALGR